MLRAWMLLKAHLSNPEPEKAVSNNERLSRSSSSRASKASARGLAKGPRPAPASDRAGTVADRRFPRPCRSADRGNRIMGMSRNELYVSGMTQARPAPPVPPAPYRSSRIHTANIGSTKK